MIQRQRWIRGPDLPSIIHDKKSLYNKNTCLSALNSTSLVMVDIEEGFVVVFDFNSKKWEVVYPGIQEFLNWQWPDSKCSSTTTFNKDSKKKLMVLISTVGKKISKFRFKI